MAWRRIEDEEEGNVLMRNLDFKMEIFILETLNIEHKPLRMNIRHRENGR